jgi:phosphoribosylanthranilate isomerase
MKLKASGISNLTDARYFAAWNVEWVGFCLEIGHPDYVTPTDIQEIKGWLVGPKIVGEFGVGQTLEEINEAIELLQLDAVQLSPFASENLASQIKNVPVIKEYVLDSLEGLESFGNTCQTLGEEVDYYLLDLQKSGIDWQKLQADTTAVELLKILCQQYQIILGIDCAASDLQSCIETIDPYGLNLKGGAEEKVGMKSFEDLDEVFDVLDEMDVLYS